MFVDKKILQSEKFLKFFELKKILSEQEKVIKTWTGILITAIHLRQPNNDEIYQMCNNCPVFKDGCAGDKNIICYSSYFLVNSNWFDFTSEEIKQHNLLSYRFNRIINIVGKKIIVFNSNRSAHECYDEYEQAELTKISVELEDIIDQTFVEKENIEHRLKMHKKTIITQRKTFTRSLLIEKIKSTEC